MGAPIFTRDSRPYGSRSKYFETPHLDKLAADGMKFTDAYAACAVCSPTRAAIMTGRYPARLGVTDWIRARFQGGKIPADKKNPSGWVGGKGADPDIGAGARGGCDGGIGWPRYPALAAGLVGLAEA